MIDDDAAAPMKRMRPAPLAEREIWAKSAGRCNFCAKYLFAEEFAYKPIAVGQVAHQVGATDGQKSPRGEGTLTANERSEPSNLMLLCQPHHQMIDGDPDRFPVEWLQRTKHDFETRVREATNFASLEPSAAVVLTAPIRGNDVSITREQISEALQFESLRFAGEHYRDSTLEVRLQLPESREDSWNAGQMTIHHRLERLQSMVDDVGAESVSLFALGPIPFLVDLGASVGNKYPVNVFEPHSVGSRTRWRWPVDAGEPNDFVIDVPSPDQSATELVVSVSLTAAVQLDRVPDPIAALPQASLRIDGEPRVGAINSQETLRNFVRAWRTLLQRVEDAFPSATRVHLVAAIGCAAAIELGRWRMRDAHPEFVVYQLLEDHTYREAITIH